MFVSTWVLTGGAGAPVGGDLGWPGINGRVRVLSMACASALHPVKGMPFRWAFNPYRGCSHACRYCYARITHEYLGFNSAEDFEGILMAKVDAPQRLARELSRPSWRRDLVAVGTATDPYQPVEGRLRLTARCLEVFLRYRTPVSLVTKSTLVVRDAGLLAELGAVASASSVWISITTLDARLARQLEPRAPPPERRLRAVARLADRGVRVGVLVAPVLPALTEAGEQLARLLEAARAAGACDVGLGVLRLGEGAREVFARWLARERPDLVPLYRRLYGGRQYVPASYGRQIQARFEACRGRAGWSQPAPRGRVEAAAESERTGGANSGAQQLSFSWG